jgi:hypothetical protein
MPEKIIIKKFNIEPYITLLKSQKDLTPILDTNEKFLKAQKKQIPTSVYYADRVKHDPTTLDENFHRLLTVYNFSQEDQKFQSKLQEVNTIPIIRASNIAEIPSILQYGLRSRATKYNNNSIHSASNAYDDFLGLSDFVFAGIGKVPNYGGKMGRVGIIISPEVLKSGSIVSFKDLAASVKSSAESGGTTHLLNNIVKEYNTTNIAAEQMYKLLTQMYIDSELNFTDFIQNINCQKIIGYSGTNSIEVKINQTVHSKHFLGYVVNSFDDLESLVSLGVDKSFILLNEANDSVIISEFYKQLIIK